MRIAMTTTLKVTAVALLALALVALISACGSSGGGDDAATGGDSASAADHSEGGQVETVGDELVVTMRTENMKFVPDTVTIAVGQSVRLRLDNHDPFVHDYTVDEPEFVVVEASGAAHADHAAVSAQDVDQEPVAVHDDDHEVDPAAQVSLEPLHIAAEGDQHAELIFEATEPGEYVFYCSVPGHREAGMEGKIIIEG